MKLTPFQMDRVCALKAKNDRALWQDEVYSIEALTNPYYRAALLQHLEDSKHAETENKAKKVKTRSGKSFGSID